VLERKTNSPIFLFFKPECPPQNSSIILHLELQDTSDHVALLADSSQEPFTCNEGTNSGKPNPVLVVH